MYDLDSDSSIVIFVNISDVIDTSDEASVPIVHVLTVLMREYVAISAGERRPFTDVGTPPREGGPLAFGNCREFHGVEDAVLADYHFYEVSAEKLELTGIVIRRPRFRSSWTSTPHPPWHLQY